MKEDVLRFVKNYNETHIEKITHEFCDGELKYCLSLDMLILLVETIQKPINYERNEN